MSPCPILGLRTTQSRSEQKDLGRPVTGGDGHEKNYWKLTFRDSQYHIIL